ncbi:GAF domain-containing protein [Sediminitomix flava]|uniref:GAF domain-containing protein n=1 Tax=Sediminitomix flava TaxID=379075 RepID=UPI001304B9FE|nr:GAF domain-containing protein [Sediminitomix flava]
MNRNLLAYVVLTSGLHILSLFPFYNNLSLVLLAPLLVHLVCSIYLIATSQKKSIFWIIVVHVFMLGGLFIVNVFSDGIEAYSLVVQEFEYISMVYSLLSILFILSFTFYSYTQLEKRVVSFTERNEKVLADNRSYGGELKRLTDKVSRFQKEKDDEKWISELHTYFIEIIRDLQENDDIYDVLLRQLALKMDLNQLSIFITKNSESSKAKLIKVASYAFDVTKHEAHEEIEEGETLLGQCLLEKQQVIIDDLPEGYLYISSGLGDASAKFLLIQPLLFHETLEGVIEIASFHKIPSHHLKFIELISIEIASMIRGKKTDKVSDELYNQVSRKMEILKEENKSLKLRLKDFEKNDSIDA